jgi:hypothetical protein
MNESEIVAFYVVPTVAVLDLVASFGLFRALRRVGLGALWSFAPVATALAWILAMAMIYWGIATTLEALSIYLVFKIAWTAVAVRFGFGRWPSTGSAEVSVQ